MNVRTISLFVVIASVLCSHASEAQVQMERLGRGVVAVRTGSNSVYIGWRLLGTDATGIAFNVYRSANGGAAVRLNTSPITATTDFVDTTANLGQPNAYSVRPVVNGVEQAASAAFMLPRMRRRNSFSPFRCRCPLAASTKSSSSKARGDRNRVRPRSEPDRNRVRPRSERAPTGV
jgi:rhamnogalacturonan endolyase